METPARPAGHRETQAAMQEAPNRQVELVGSLAEFAERQLAVTPAVDDAARQQALTDQFLTPALPALDALMREVRSGVDAALRPNLPPWWPKPYPLGRCLEITRLVEGRLDVLEPQDLSGPAREGWNVLCAFRAAGGRVRRAWGDLRGQYFQNALIVGALYVDVSNDTVVVTKPPVEILPFAEAGFSPIRDYGHFAHIAGRYWGYRFLRNHLLPDLAPYWPLIQIARDGRISLGPANSYMLGLTVARGLEPSARALAGPPLDPVVFATLRSALSSCEQGVATGAEAGRAAALANCRAWGAGGAEGQGAAEAAFNRAVLARLEINRRLAAVTLVAAAA